LPPPVPSRTPSSSSLLQFPPEQPSSLLQRVCSSDAYNPWINTPDHWSGQDSCSEYHTLSECTGNRALHVASWRVSNALVAMTFASPPPPLFLRALAQQNPTPSLSRISSGRRRPLSWFLCTALNDVS
jgi:hypothetical protein